MEAFELLGSDRDRFTHYDFYVLQHQIPAEEVVLQPGETDGAKWVSFAQVHEMIRQRQICKVIANQFLRQEEALKKRQTILL